ncbi:MAG: hypothetical protein H0W58_14770 [Acidobacteria bacterium]|jgi:uncharacterized membrane protein|nr:hypothetical protein [Acidobacteriota bacterium]
MLKRTNQKILKTAGLFNATLAMLLLFGLTTFAQTTNMQAATMQTTSEKSVTQILQPVLTNYKNVKIGTTSEEVREKLGKAKIDDKDGFYYEISDDEIVQIRIDKDKKVRFISVTYSDEIAPKFADVFGKDIMIESAADGKIYKLVRYPEAGYWVAYARSSGEKPTVTVTMQKMRKVK